MTIRQMVVVLLLLEWFLCAPIWVAAQVATQATAVPKELTIRFEGGLTTANFGEVIAALGARDFLPLVKYVDRDGLSPAEILANNERLVGGSVAPVLEIYLCKLNRHVCDLETSGTAQRARWRNIKAPPGSAAPEQECLQGHLPAYILCLPDIKVHRYFTSTVFPYDSKREKLEELVVKRSGGCPKFDERCQRIIKDLNRAQLPEASDKIRLPVAAYRVTLPVADAGHLDRITATLDQVIQRIAAKGGLAQQQANLYYTVTTPLKPQSHPVNPVEIDSDPMTAYLKPLEIMKYPYRTAKEFYKEKMALVTVGIWDTHVDPEHCDYVARDVKAIALSDPIPFNKDTDPVIPPTAPDCDNMRDPLELRWDHGTHVAGIVGARFNGHGIAGINPRALLWTYEIDGGARLDKDDDPLYRIVTSSEIRIPTVINISLAEEMNLYQSLLEAFIKKNLHVLWVTASGNDGAEVDRPANCRIIPACLSTFDTYGDSVISVVALDADGVGRWFGKQKSSNWGIGFDVAAVGVTVSTLHGNSFGLMAGTSVATPYVSGLASLIFATSRTTLMPKQVKDRILYTVDFTNALDSIVHFGRINFTRALRFQTDRVELKKDFCPVSGCEFPRNVKKALESITVTEGIQDGKEFDTDVDLKMSSIRRIAAKDDSDRFWIVYTDSKGTLHKIQDAKIRGTPQLKFKDAVAPAAVAISTVKDYTCSLSCN